MNDLSLYEKAYTGRKEFPFEIGHTNIKSDGLAFYAHWHEQPEILYFVRGGASVECGSSKLQLQAGDVVVINSNELHCGYCTESPLEYYCIIFDSIMLKGCFDGSCEQKYLIPFEQNQVLFDNKPSKDLKLIDVIHALIKENEIKESAYELFVKSKVYELIGILFRQHVKIVLSDKEHMKYARTMQRMNSVLDYIDKNLMETITLETLAGLACLSKYHFCHMFKKHVGKSVGEYINVLRLDKAEMLLKNTDMNVTEVAYSVGYNDANYFSRLFRKIKKVTPKSMK